MPVLYGSHGLSISRGGVDERVCGVQVSDRANWQKCVLCGYSLTLCFEKKRKKGRQCGHRCMYVCMCVMVMAGIPVLFDEEKGHSRHHT